MLTWFRSTMARDSIMWFIGPLADLSLLQHPCLPPQVNRAQLSPPPLEFQAHRLQVQQRLLGLVRLCGVSAVPKIGEALPVAAAAPVSSQTSDARLRHYVNKF